MRKSAGFASIVAMALFLGQLTPAAMAQSLNEAMSLAYMTNPTLRAARAGQRATDELVPQAMSGWRPTVTANGSIGRQHQDVTPPGSTIETTDDTGTPGSLSITLSQPIFRGFKTVNGVKAAKAAVAAGEQGLLATEQNVLFLAVRAYMDVIRDRSIVSLRSKNVSVLRAQLKAANDRFNVGEVTRTDVAQARARLSAVQALLAAAEASLATSTAAYVKTIGSAPGQLGYPRIPKLPASLDSAMATASEINPNVLAAALIEEASVHQIEVAKGDLLPTVSLQAQASVQDDLSITGSTNKSASVMGVVTVPLYDGGRTYSSVREAKQTASQRRIQVIEANRAVREAVAIAWNSLYAARQTITAAKSQVSAASLALDGVRQEYDAGTRTTLDVLNAQAELFDAQITQVTAEHDSVVAAYQLLSAMGQLTASHLSLNVSAYDPAENYETVRKKWFGTDANVVK